ncbi:unnamed protein product [Symbiodinium natans]|uniref:Uncharacterized protein n=1 Tax=Symbiodinium natans TaxID=878477 RepID=A0A812T8N7_9DINO|nr:unnamed protein product [Symbiodinium natans]
MDTRVSVPEGSDDTPFKACSCLAEVGWKMRSDGRRLSLVTQQELHRCEGVEVALKGQEAEASRQQRPGTLRELFEDSSQVSQEQYHPSKCQREHLKPMAATWALCPAAAAWSHGPLSSAPATGHPEFETNSRTAGCLMQPKLQCHLVGVMPFAGPSDATSYMVMGLKHHRQRI